MVRLGLFKFAFSSAIALSFLPVIIVPAAALASDAAAGAKTAPLPPQEAALVKRVDAAIDQAIEQKRIVGTVVLIAKNGKIIYHKGKGLSDREAKTPMETTAIFRFASLTKPLVSVAALKMVENGLLKLDDPVAKFIPTFLPKTADGKTPTLTIQQLLTHTAGLNYVFMEKANGPYRQNGVSDGLTDIGITLDENLNRIAKAPLLFEPGTAWHYSLATDVLGRVLEKVSEKSLGEVLSLYVSKPLGLKDTEFVASHPERLATPYGDGKPEPVRMGKDHSVPFGTSSLDYSPGRATNPNAYPSGGAGAVGTADDYLKFLEAIRTRDPKFLAAKTYEQIFTNQIGDLPVITGPGWEWGLISALLVDPKPTKSKASAGTIQWGGAYGHSWFVDPKSGLTVIALTNTAIEGMSGKFPAALKDAVYGQ